MSKSSPRRVLGRRTGTVTVIEPRVQHSIERNAKLAFFVTTFAVGMLAATVLADRWHPILALFAGGILGAITGSVVWLLVRVWPYLRALWWWTPEILLAAVVVYGFTALARHATLPLRLAVVALLVGVPA